jgi:DNA-binding NarL/FixJ family response regulator
MLGCLAGLRRTAKQGGGGLERSIRVLAVEDYEPFRDWLRSTLKQLPELQVIAEAADGMTAVEKAEALRPDLILLDIGLPALNGFEAARRIRRLSPRSKILFVTENSSRDMAAEALRLGAAGYVVKRDAARELLPAVESVLGGRQFVSARLAAREAPCGCAH